MARLRRLHRDLDLGGELLMLALCGPRGEHFGGHVLLRAAALPRHQRGADDAAPASADHRTQRDGRAVREHHAHRRAHLRCIGGGGRCRRHGLLRLLLRVVLLDCPDVAALEAEVRCELVGGELVEGVDVVKALRLEPFRVLLRDAPVLQPHRTQQVGKDGAVVRHVCGAEAVSFRFRERCPRAVGIGAAHRARPPGLPSALAPVSGGRRRGLAPATPFLCSLQRAASPTQIEDPPPKW
jgi:hypothetical protein